MEALRLLSCIFGRLLSLDNDQSLICHLSLETFASFAELTTHESVVADSVSTSDDTRQTVVNFLSRVSNNQGCGLGLDISVLKMICNGFLPT